MSDAVEWFKGLFVIAVVITVCSVPVYGYLWLKDELTDAPEPGIYQVDLPVRGTSASVSSIRVADGELTVFLRLQLAGDGGSEPLTCPGPGPHGFGQAVRIASPPAAHFWIENDRPAESSAEYSEFVPQGYECRGKEGKRFESSDIWASFPLRKEFGRRFFVRIAAPDSRELLTTGSGIVLADLPRSDR